MERSGKDNEKASQEATPTEGSPADSGSGTPCCAPGCGCGTPSGGKTVKIAVCLIVLSAIAGIFIYKAVAAKSNGSNGTPVRDDASFALGQLSPCGTPGTTSQPAAGMQDSPKAGQKVGEYLESLSSLNKVAASQDAVFVFIPAGKNDLADGKTNTAMLATQQTLKSRNIKLGLYTLPSSSPDYPKVCEQVKAPAILVACKGKGMAAVSGDVTEQKLLQAFVASSSAGACGPSGCGPSTPGCN